MRYGRVWGVRLAVAALVASFLAATVPAAAAVATVDERPFAKLKVLHFPRVIEGGHARVTVEVTCTAGATIHQLNVQVSPERAGMVRSSNNLLGRNSDIPAGLACTGEPVRARVDTFYPFPFDDAPPLVPGRGVAEARLYVHNDGGFAESHADAIVWLRRPRTPR